MDAPELRRGIFGYSRKSVDRLLGELDLRLVQSTQDVRQAEAKMAELMFELESVNREAQERSGLIELAEAATARAQGQLAEAHRARTEAERKVVEFETMASNLESGLDEAGQDPATSIDDALQAAQHAVDELFESSRHKAEEELREYAATRDKLRSEIEHLVAWREQVMPLAEEVRRSIAEVRAGNSVLAGHLEKLAVVPPPIALVASPDVIRLDAVEPEIPSFDQPLPRDRAGTGI